VYNAEQLGTSLDTSIYAVYNAESNTNDSSGNGRNGTNVNNVTFTTGKVGNAFTFNGSNYITLPNNSMNLTGDFSISCWVNITVISGVQMFLSTYQTIGGVEYGFWLRVINGFQFTVFNGPTRIDTNPSGGAISTNTWYHVVVTKTSSQIKWYINGVANNVFNGTYNIPYHPTSNIAAIGSLYKWNGTDTNQFMSNGSKIDGLTVWNKVLTANEVTSLYNGGLGAEYPFSSQTLPTYNDALGNYNGTSPSSTVTNGIHGPSFTTGKIGKAFQFDGINDYIQLPNASLNLPDNFTISAWVNFSSFPSSSTIVSNYYRLSPFTVYYGWSALMIGDKIAFDIFNGVNALYVRLLSPSIPSNTWKHVTLIHKKNTSLSIYIDGVFSVSTPTTTPIGYSGNETPTIGGVQAGTGFQYPTNGKIDAFNVWNRELSASEVTELYNSGNGKQYPN